MAMPRLGLMKTLHAVIMSLTAIMVILKFKPNPCLAPITKGPYYAMMINPGDIGTKGGLLTNDHGQVVRPFW